MSSFDESQTDAARDFMWPAFEQSEFGTDTEYGNVDLFTIAADGLVIDQDRSERHDPVTQTADGYEITTTETLAVREPLDLSTFDQGPIHNAALALGGMKLAVRLIRISTEVRTQSTSDPDDKDRAIQTQDGVEVLDLDHKPEPYVLEEFFRPEVRTVIDDDPELDASDVLSREFTDPTRPTYEKLLDLLKVQREYRGLLFGIIAARGISLE